MAEDLNVYSCTGRLVKDFELRYTGGGDPVGGSTIAVNKRRKGEDTAMFLDFTIFGKYAEAMNTYLTKGKQIAVNGFLQQDHWEKEGRKHSKIKLVVSNLVLLGGNDKPKAEKSYSAPPQGNTARFEDDIPF